MTIDELKKGDLVNFDMIIPGILGDQYKSVIVSGIVDYTVASQIDSEVNVKHQNFYPQFKDTVGNVNDPSIYSYLLVRPDPTTNLTIVIGGPWIRADSLETTRGRFGSILIQNWEERYRAPVTDFLNNLQAQYTLTVEDKK